MKVFRYVLSKGHKLNILLVYVDDKLRFPKNIIRLRRDKNNRIFRLFLFKSPQTTVNGTGKIKLHGK